MSDFFSFENIILILVALGIGTYLIVTGKKFKKNPASKYAVITVETIKFTPKKDLLKAVLLNQFGAVKSVEEVEEIEAIVKKWTKGQSAVCSVHKSVSELAEISDIDTMVKYVEENAVQKTRINWVNRAYRGLLLVGAKECAEEFNTLMNLEEIGMDDIEAWKKAVDHENPLALCADYIKANPEMFVGEI